MAKGAGNLMVCRQQDVTARTQLQAHIHKWAFFSVNTDKFMMKYLQYIPWIMNVSSFLIQFQLKKVYCFTKYKWILDTHSST